MKTNIFDNVISIESFSLSNKLNLKKINNGGRYIGYVYLLYCEDDKGYFFKIGETLNLNKRMSQYASNGTKYKFCCALSYSSNNKQELKNKIKQKEYSIIQKLKVKNETNLIYGNEHFFSDNFSILEELNNIFSINTKEDIKYFTHKKTPLISYTDKVYKEQELSGEEIYHNFKSHNIVLLKAHTQGGKTGAIAFAMGLIANEYRNRNKKIPNMILATSYHENEWRFQTIDRIPLIDNPNWGDKERVVKDEKVMKLADLLKFIKNKEEINEETFIFIDESQRAGKYNQTMAKFFNNVLGLNTSLHYKNPKDFNQQLTDNKLKVCFVSATDFYIDSAINHDSYSPYIKRVELEVNENYRGFWHYYNEGRIHNFVEFYDKKFDDLNMLVKNEFEELLNSDDPNRYIIVRKNSKDSMELLRRVIEDEFDDCFRVWEHHGTSKLNNAADILKNKPDKPTIIIIKEYWRMSKTIPIENIALVFDRYVKNSRSQSIDTILQGLLGRLTGYKKKYDIKVFTNLEMIEAYLNKSEDHKLDNRTSFKSKNNISFNLISTHNEFIELSEEEKYNLQFYVNEDGEETNNEKIIRKRLKDVFGNNITIRSIPRTRARIKGKIKIEDIDNDFDNIDSFPDKGIISGGASENKPIVLWINYDKDNPIRLKVTIMKYKKEIKDKNVITHQGILPVDLI